MILFANGQCNNCSKPVVRGLVRCETCQQKHRDYNNKNKTSVKSSHRYKEIVYNYYGQRCVCCGETNLAFLTIDHINGRENTPEGKSKAYYYIARFIIAGNPRSDIQILCFNCNCGKHRNYGTCPHKEIH